MFGIVFVGVDGFAFVVVGVGILVVVDRLCEGGEAVTWRSSRQLAWVVSKQTGMK